MLRNESDDNNDDDNDDNEKGTGKNKRKSSHDGFNKKNWRENDSKSGQIWLKYLIVKYLEFELI